MLRKDLAEALGISAAMVTRLAKRGMPTHDVQAARRWRDKHLEPARRKERRIDYATERPRATPPVVPRRERGAAEAAMRLCELAAKLLAAGQPIDTLVPDLRAALSAVEVEEWPSVRIDRAVWDVLVADVRTLVEDRAEADGDQPQALSNGEAVDMGWFWYGVAAGQWVVADGAIVESGADRWTCWISLRAASPTATR